MGVKIQLLKKVRCQYLYWGRSAIEELCVQQGPQRNMAGKYQHICRNNHWLSKLSLRRLAVWSLEKRYCTKVSHIRLLGAQRCVWKPHKCLQEGPSEQLYQWVLVQAASAINAGIYYRLSASDNFAEVNTIAERVPTKLNRRCNDNIKDNTSWNCFRRESKKRNRMKDIRYVMGPATQGASYR